MAEKTKQVKKSDVGHYDLFSVMNQTSDLIIKDHRYGIITKRIKEKIDDVFKNYLSIGYLLLEAKNNNIFEVNKYKDIYEYASKEFELSSTTTKNVMHIVSRFCDEDGDLLEKYQDYSFSNLVELLPVPDNDIDKFKPTMTVKSVRDKKLELEINKQLQQAFDSDGILTKLINQVESFNWNKQLSTTGYEITHEIKREKYESIDNDYWGSKYNFQIIFTLKKDKSKLGFHIEFDMERKNFTFDLTDGYINLNSVSDEKTVNESLIAIANRFIKYDMVLTDQKKEKLKKEKSSQMTSPGYSLLKKIYDESYHDEFSSSLSKVKKMLSTLSDSYYYDGYGYSYETDIKIYGEGKRHKKKNPILYEIKDIDDPLLTTVNVFDENGEIKESIKVFEGIDKFMSEKLEVLKEIIK